MRPIEQARSSHTSSMIDSRAFVEIGGLFEMQLFVIDDCVQYLWEVLV